MSNFLLGCLVGYFGAALTGGFYMWWLNGKHRERTGKMPDAGYP